MVWFRFTLAVGISLALLVTFAGEELAQQGDRGVRVQGRQPTESEQRVALVIGNSSYTRISRLNNPVNDAVDIAAALKRSGFKVMLLQDANRKEMNRAIRELGQLLKKVGSGCFITPDTGCRWAA